MTQTASVLAASSSPAPRRTQLASAPQGDRRDGPVVHDEGMAAADQLRTMAVRTAAPNPLDQVPRSMLADGTTHLHAKGKMLFITKDLGEATVTRTPTEIDVQGTGASATIKVDAEHPGMVDVALHMGEAAAPQFYQGTITPTAGGFVANTTDGKRLTATQKGSEIDIKAQGFPGVPGGATLILTPA